MKMKQLVTQVAQELLKNLLPSADTFISTKVDGKTA